MNFLEILENLNPEIYENLKRSLEVGKWPDDERLTKNQQEIVMQSLIAWSEIHLPEHKRIGYIEKGTKEIAGDCISDSNRIPLVHSDSGSN